jgi:hypothetical protein
MSPERDMVEGERVEVRLNGLPEEEWYAATVTGKARKMQVTLDEHPFGREPFTYEADENSIAEWRPLSDQTLPPGLADDDGPEIVDEFPARPRNSGPSDADRELLMLAARAIGAVRVEVVDGENWLNLHFADGSTIWHWNSLVHADDTFNLAADLGLQVSPVARTASGSACSAVGDSCGRRLSEVTEISDVRAATRLAITRAAAEIGKQRS